MKKLTNPNFSTKPQWLKRVEVVHAIYADLIYAYQHNQTSSRIEAYLSWDEFQKLILSEYLAHKNEFLQKISQYLNATWSLSRMNLVTIAIMVEALSEAAIFHTPKKILIQQAIITTQKISEYNDFKIVNAILDQCLVNE